ncbi:Sodium/potassium-transporting ATPase subunit beta-2 [Cryptotermes secundus]|uniref:Sodium/potassium-transporting ATPase subunit beta-2 n=1 Tax=Cryptotermes secundus TaxID=105785 RepID=A0A2J7RL62_9NEOP|nr:Sodium/potassium-transporting ATPase subunit beta-2 [Cryptotermes secundus]PNF41572.1 Sodium/potassium-transporting ATPase subunit beta-2 [Cryptotermes secundus]
MSKNVENNKDGGILSPEVGLPKPESFKVFLYNPKTGAVLGRTAGSWLKIIIFYLTFYFFLAAFFALAMWMFMQTINDDGPKYYLDDSIIGTSPGLGFRPLSMEHEGSTLIWYNASSKNNHKNWTMNLDTFLEGYKNQTNNSDVVRCDYGNKPGHNEVCNVPVDNWDPCTSENDFDFVNSRPCVFIKLNKILKWEPEYYKSVKDLPSQMPKDLREHIERMAKNSTKFLNTVWVSCEGQYPADKEFIGTVEYIPDQGFPGYYYPFLGTKTYLSPLVAVHFKNISRNVLVSVECKAWAHNIVHDRRDRIGLVQFQLLVD